MTKNEVLSVREQIQEDLICLLDSQFGEVKYVGTLRGHPQRLHHSAVRRIYHDDKVKDLACQIVVDNFNKLDLDSLDNVPCTNDTSPVSPSLQDSND